MIWLWVVTTSLVTVFKIAKSRGEDVAREMLGDFKGVLGVDRWSAYNFVDSLRRQLCWSHLKRDFLGFVDRGGKAQRLDAAHLIYVVDGGERPVPAVVQVSDARSFRVVSRGAPGADGAPRTGSTDRAASMAFPRAALVSVERTDLAAATEPRAGTAATATRAARAATSALS